MFKGKRTYGEFLNAGEGISTNILADRLARLEENGIVTKTIDRTNRARFNYRLTEKGLDLMPMMFAMIDWSEKYDGETEVPSTFIEKLRKSPQTLRRELRRSLEKMD
jgi:DNA-binding HxlR family transcriptional regulator